MKENKKISKEKVEEIFKEHGLTPNYGNKTGCIAIFPGNKSSIENSNKGK